MFRDSLREADKSCLGILLGRLVNHVYGFYLGKQTNDV